MADQVPSRGMSSDVRPVPWSLAWQDALYGPDGFYRQPFGPAGHFTTATHGRPGAVLARALWSWADRLGADGIVDLGAGRGELVTHLYAAAPGRPLAGLDVVARPDNLPDAIGWAASPGGAGVPEHSEMLTALTGGLPASHTNSSGPSFLVVANEWLDVVPCTVGEVDSAGVLRVVLVDRHSGAESLGEPLADADLQWCEEWWPAAVRAAAAPGDRVEVGRARDDAWAGLLGLLGGGPALAIDYGHLRASRPTAGTLSAYRSGRLVHPVPDGSCDLTAHVAVDSLRGARLLSQRSALDEVGITAALPDPDLARTDPGGYLAAVADSSAAGFLRSPDGLGGFSWVISH